MTGLFLLGVLGVAVVAGLVVMLWPKSVGAGMDGRGTFPFARDCAVLGLEAMDQAFEDWHWLRGTQDLHPIALTRFADFFLVDNDGHVYFLDTSFGILEPIASSLTHLRERAETEPEFATALLRRDLLRPSRTATGALQQREVYGFIAPLVFGGEATHANIERGDALAFVSLYAQLARAAHGVQPGELLRVEFEGWPDDFVPPIALEGEHTVAARDRPSFAWRPSQQGGARGSRGGPRVG